ncbi:ABC transporter substrate-binding protein [Alteromonas sp. W364]|jgi:phospholipid transport system substrate-binding protein|uniref:ABC transporter substrate-binding protein n=1 Tax=Alteromonas sp. W364 TaxID=3075610 RepID=UPI0028841DE1|nr:ABC transporter substrate-binding protein [Alteromonas sp. W364]MDT0629011.1 ABC transporter substrate-binding protein [Alteromonas sp. W364]
MLTAMMVILTASSAHAAKQDDPYLMIQEVAGLTFERMKKEKDAIKQDPELLRKVMEEELLPYIDYRFSAFKVLGKYAQKVPREKLLEFVSVFREYLITSYAVALGYYDDQFVEFAPAINFDGRSDVTVRAVIKDDERPDIKVAFKVRKDRKSNEWQAYDMVAEGISLLSSKRSEFESVLRQDGIDRVIELMRESIEQPIVLEEK